MTAQLVAFARAGGAPPPSRETVQVLTDGTVRATIATVWDGTADVAGRFEFTLARDRLAELEELAARAEPVDAGPRRPGSGSIVVTLPGERRIDVSPFAKLDGAPAALVARLDELRAEAREHPVAAVRLSLQGAQELSFVLTAAGTTPVTVAVRAARVRVVAGSGTEPPPLLWSREARPVSVAASAELAPGEDLVLPASVAVEAGPHRIDGFVDVAFDGVDAVLAAGPVLRG